MDKRQKLRAKRRQLINEIKMETGCQRCGYRENVAALVFHHRDPSTKLFNVAAQLCGSLARLIAEIAKCDVLCANCHAIEHHKEDF